MAESKSKRDLIWEQKRKQREDRLMSQQSGNNEYQNNIYSQQQQLNQDDQNTQIFQQSNNQEFQKQRGLSPDIQQQYQDHNNSSLQKYQGANQNIPQQRFYPQNDQDFNQNQRFQQRNIQPQSIQPQYIQQNYQTNTIPTQMQPQGERNRLVQDIDTQVPYQQSTIPSQYPPPHQGARNRLQQENTTIQEINKKNQQKLELKQALQQQMEERKQKKEMEEKRKKEERIQEGILPKEGQREGRQYHQQQGNLQYQNNPYNQQYQMNSGDQNPQIFQQPNKQEYQQSPYNQQYQDYNNSGLQKYQVNQNIPQQRFYPQNDQDFNQNQRFQQRNIQPQPQYIQQNYQTNKITPQQDDRNRVMQESDAQIYPQQGLIQAQVQPPPQVGRNRLQQENTTMEEINKKAQQKLEMKQALQQQMDERKNKKEMEEKRRKDEERIEEERIRKEREEIEKRVKEEENQKKKKEQSIQQANENLIKFEQENKQQKKRRNQREEEEKAPVAQPQQINSEISRNYLINEKQREGVNQNQSLLDFYKNGPQSEQQSIQNVYSQPYFGLPQHEIQQQFQQQVLPLQEIEMLKRQMQDQQLELQRQIQNVMMQAQQAMEGRNIAERELVQLKNQVYEKYLQEEQNHKDLMLALVKNDPKWEKQIFPPHIVAQAQINEERDLSMPAVQNFEQVDYENVLSNKNVQQNNQFYPFQEGKPVVMGPQTSQKQEQSFKQQFGLQSLVSDSNFVPIDILDKLKQQNLDQINIRDKTPNLRVNLPQKVILPQIEELNNQYEESMIAADTFNLENYQNINQPLKLAQDSININTLNSDITKDIDALLNYKPHHTLLQDQNYRRTPSAQRSNSAKNRPPSSLSQAARGLLNQNSNIINDLNNPYSTGNAYGTLLDDHQGGYKLGSQLPDLSLQKPPKPKINNNNFSNFNLEGGTINSIGTNTLDVAQINKKADQRLMQLKGYGLEDSQGDEELAKLDKLLQNYAQK